MFAQRRPRPRPDGTLEVTLIQLEMDKPHPQPNPVPLGSKLAIMRLDRPAVAFYRFLYDAVGRDWGWVDRKRLGDAELGQIIQDDRTEIYVLYVGGVPAGYAEFDCREFPEITLTYFGLTADFIGRGLGPFFLRSVLIEAWAKSPSKIKVSTQNTEHPAALPLYQKVGFRPVAARDIIVDLRL
jgi:GNAT superfamily N-acetyltransferase